LHEINEESYEQSKETVVKNHQQRKSRVLIEDEESLTAAANTLRQTNATLNIKEQMQSFTLPNNKALN